MKRIIGTAVLAGILTLGWAGGVEAHNADVSATCQGGVAYNTSVYTATVANTITVSIDGHVVSGFPKTFGSGISGSVPNPDKTVSHIWSASVNQADGNEFDFSFSGIIPACVTPPTTTVPPTTVAPTTTIGATTSTSSPPTTTLPPATSTTASTVSTTTAPTTSTSSTTIPPTSSVTSPSTTAPSVAAPPTVTTTPPTKSLPVTGAHAGPIAWIAAALVGLGLLLVLGLDNRHPRY